MTLQEFLNRYSYDPEKDCIGEGGFGRVYKAYDNVLDRYVAVKISVVRQVAGKTFSLQSEVETACSLPAHTNIAQYESVHRFQLPTGVSDFAVIQYYPEGNLTQLLESKRLSMAQRGELLWALLEGLKHLHSHNIIHRDLKPGNILIVARSQSSGMFYVPKIADFGLSKIVRDHNSHISSSFAGGTVEYSSPEQLKGEPLRYNSDLWSWAVIAYEVLTGKKLFVADASSSAYHEGGAVEAIFNLDIEVKLSQIGEPWQRLLRSCLQREPQARVHDVFTLLRMVDLEGGGTIVLDSKNQTVRGVQQPPLPVELAAKNKKLTWIISLVGAVLLFASSIIFIFNDSGGVTSISSQPTVEELYVVDSLVEAQSEKLDSETVEPQFKGEQVETHTQLSSSKKQASGRELIIEDSEEIFSEVEESAEFPGGIPELMKYLGSNIRYPKIAAENGIQGRVFVSFIVEHNGKISQVTIERGVDPSLDKEAVRVVESMPAWNPGKMRGNPVRTRCTLPIAFKLT